MQVSFKSRSAAVRTRDEYPTERLPEENNKGGVFSTGKEIWKGTLKGYDGVKTFAWGTYKGIRNAAYAGAGVVALDYLVTASKNQVSVGKMVWTPLSLAGEALYRGGRYFIEFCKPSGPSIPKTIKDLCTTVGKVFKKIYHAPNLSRFSRWGLPIIATTVAAYTIVRSKLDYNEHAAKIDHRYGGVHGHHDGESE